MNEKMKKMIKFWNSGKGYPPWTIEAMNNEGYTPEEQLIIQDWWFKND